MRRAHLHPVAEEHEGHQQGRGLEEGLLAERHQGQAAAVCREHAGGDEHAHMVSASAMKNLVRMSRSIAAAIDGSDMSWPISPWAL
jgi:hypothetical protein